ncbi:response regulator, partial [bacterium]|nr:response regulator [bacterium]
MTEKAIKILIVDDNARYREAFSENLMLQGMEVFQAEHADQAIELLKTQSPDVMVTDLQMRRATEGLDLIRDARIIEPCLPVIMISAVGTFDEGAQASQLGAAHVLSKARIEEE